ncbi:MAG: hypothetical protein R3Y32_05880 [Bacillota bacterium]
MKYFRNTTKYVFRNFPMLLLFAFIPAIILCFTGNIWKFVAFFANSNAVSLSFGQIYSYFSFMFGESVLLGLLGIFVVAFFASLTFSAIERHMKIGKISISRPFARVDETILAVLPVFAFYIIMLEFCALFNTTIIVCAGLVSSTFASVVAVVSTLVIYGASIVVAVQIIFWIPSMIVLGYPLKSALIFSMNSISGKTSYAFKHFAISIILGTVISGCAYVFLSGIIGAFTPLIITAVYLLLFMFIISYSMVAFFDVAEETRNDIKGKKNYIT